MSYLDIPQLETLKNSFRNGDTALFDQGKPYPEEPAGTYRWFLQRKIADEGRRVLIIGMNPSNAAKIDYMRTSEKLTGDRTTEDICTRFKLDSTCALTPDEPREKISSIAIINLIPVIASKPEEATKKWKEIPQSTQREIIGHTKELAELAISTSDIIYPMWGGIKKFHWKHKPAKLLTGILKGGRENKRVKAVRNKDDSPCHIRVWGNRNPETFPFKKNKPGETAP